VLIAEAVDRAFPSTKRRAFIALLGGAAAAWPLAARAQQGDAMRRIGVLMGFAESDPEAYQVHIAPLRDGLQKLGWTDRNTWIDTRWATPADAESMQRFAKELVALQPDVILSNTTPTTAALLQQTRTIPIVFALVVDPIGSGFVASFPRPGGNVTGFIVTEPTMAGKWLELLKEIAPHVARVAMLFNPATATYAEYWLTPFKAAAASFGVEAIVAPVHDRSELESVVAAQTREPYDGLIAMPDSFTVAHRVEITSLAARYRLPAVRSVSSLKSAACCPTEIRVCHQPKDCQGARHRNSTNASRPRRRGDRVESLQPRVLCRHA
jgi:ABC-type uncharacterized transport system substrate-binding protein